ncbi:MAG: Rho termination factor N-terminal domain-containing protein [Caldicoprobacterales bacterium]
MDLNNLEKNTIIQLREFGRELGVKSVTRHRKQQLIELIKEKLQEMAAHQEEQHRLKESGKGVGRGTSQRGQGCFPGYGGS